jgi:hypothetical protein
VEPVVAGELGLAEPGFPGEVGAGEGCPADLTSGEVEFDEGGAGEVEIDTRPVRSCWAILVWAGVQVIT